MLKTVVVDRASAQTGCGSSKKIPANHIDIVKPRDRQNRSYALVSERLVVRQLKQRYDSDPH